MSGNVSGVHDASSQDASERTWMAASLAVVGVVAVGNFALQSTDVSGVLVLGPLVASTRARPAGTAAVAQVALAVALLSAAISSDGWEATSLVRLVGVLVGGSLAVAAAGWRVERERKLRAVARVADVAQQAILTPVPRVIGDVRLATRYRSAASEAVVGGDFYDAIHTAKGVRVLVGDVRGKGLDAVRLAARVVGAFRLAALRNDDLDGIVGDLERCVTPALGDEDFVTALVAQFSGSGTVEIVSCGHPPPVVVDESPLALPVTSRPPLGLGGAVAVDAIPLPPTTRLLFCTDGLLEARSASGRYLDVGAVLGAAAHRCDEELLDEVLARVDEHTDGELGDDLALVLITPRSVEYEGGDDAGDNGSRRAESRSPAPYDTAVSAPRLRSSPMATATD
jgi:sigma-B regulation protein RsbU (phosphoserine phosphatase)